VKIDVCSAAYDAEAGGTDNPLDLSVGLSVHWTINPSRRGEKMKQDQRVARQIADLAQLPYDQLKERWRVLFGKEPLAYNRVFLVNRLAHRIQELTYGGLSETTRERMRQILIANGFDETACNAGRGRGSAKQGGHDMPVLGTRLSREWNGRRHDVTVVTGGFEYEGRRYRSLTAVARAITGAHWSGRAFFGLAPRRQASR